jgi:hypothetical protein
VLGTEGKPLGLLRSERLLQGADFPCVRPPRMLCTNPNSERVEMDRERCPLHSDYLMTGLGYSLIFRDIGLTSVGNILGPTNLEDFLCAIALYAIFGMNR